MPDIKQDDFQEPIYEPKDSEAYKIIGIVFIICLYIKTDTRLRKLA